MQSIYPPMTRENFSRWKSSFNKYPTHQGHATILKSWFAEGIVCENLLDVPTLHPAMLAQWEKDNYPKGNWYTSFLIQNIADISFWPEERIKQVITAATSLTYNFVQQIVNLFPEYVPLLDENRYKMEHLELREWFMNQLNLSPSEQVSKWFQELDFVERTYRSNVNKNNVVFQWGSKVRSFIQEHKEVTLQTLSAKDVLQLYNIALHRKELRDILKTILYQRSELIFQINWKTTDMGLLLQLADRKTLGQWRVLDEKAPKKNMSLYGSQEYGSLNELLGPWLTNLSELWQHIGEIECYHMQSAKSFLTLLDKAVRYEGTDRITSDIKLCGLSKTSLLDVLQGKGDRHDREQVRQLFGERRVKNMQKALEAVEHPKNYINQFNHIADFYCSVAYEANKKKRITAMNESIPETDGTMIPVEEVSLLF